MSLNNSHYMRLKDVIQCKSEKHNLNRYSILAHCKEKKTKPYRTEFSDFIENYFNRQAKLSKTIYPKCVRW